MPKKCKDTKKPSPVETDWARIDAMTDETFFGGSDTILSAVKAAVSLPLLRKEFIIDPYQIHETRAIGAEVAIAGQRGTRHVPLANFVRGGIDVFVRIVAIVARAGTIAIEIGRIERHFATIIVQIVAGFGRKRMDGGARVVAVLTVQGGAPGLTAGLNGR